MRNQSSLDIPLGPNLRLIAEQNNTVLKQIFNGKIKGYFLIDVKDQIMKELGINNLIKYYDFRWSDVRMITGIEEAAEYDICRMIVGIHKTHSIFLSDNEIHKNEKSKRYKQLLIAETIEKIKMRLYGSIYFRKKILFQGEEFLYYPLPYELFVISTKMSQMLMEGDINNCQQLYYGVIYNSISALLLLEDNLFGTAYPLCRGAMEMYFKLLILVSQPKLYNQYENFRMFEIEYSCHQSYSENFNALFEKRIFQKTKSKADYLHFGWVDNIDRYQKVVEKSPYSVYGIITFLKEENKEKILELEWLENFYKSCHAYTHGSIQMAKYPVLHYFEISIMLYFIIRETFLLLCNEKQIQTMIGDQDIISMLDRDFNILQNQYKLRSTESFERYYNLGSL